jgi:tetratricopeptide (TPR) repeat protein
MSSDRNRRQITRPWRLIAVALGVGGLFGAWAWRADQNYRHAIMAIELQMANGRYGVAARELNKLLTRVPDDAEAAILLGRCEQERGRLREAAEALARVKPGSELSHKATLARMRLLYDQGQFAAAEELITKSALDPRAESAHVRVLLVPIFSLLGRIDEAKRLLENWWERLDQLGEGASERAIDQVRMHIELDLRPNPVDQARADLDEAARRAPNDDRVWLGQANLAIRTARYDEARTLLDQCLKNRPDDIPVWIAMLELGKALDRPDLVEQALSHLPPRALATPETDRIDAWLCAHRGDEKSERRALERLVAASPGDLPALARLAELAERSGKATEAADFRARHAASKKVHARFRQLFDRNQPIRDAEELADLAEKLGRMFEARGFLTIELATDPTRDDLRARLKRLPDRSERSPVLSAAGR